MKQRILSWLLIACMLCSLLPHSIVTASGAIYSGTCGDNLTWLLDTDTGVLTISGTGAMEDYDSLIAPWKDYWSSIKEVNVEEGVTHIGKDAFSNCWYITAVSIPSSVKSIGKEAFCEDTDLHWVFITDLLAWCRISFEDASANPLIYRASLYINGDLADEISIPNSVSTIGNYAFYGCGSIERVIIPNSVTAIGKTSFSGCDSLTSVTVPDSVTAIGDDAFRGCNKLTDIHITDLSTWCEINFESATANPLYYGDNLYINGELTTDIMIPDGVTTICDYAFASFGGMKNLTIPNSVASVGEDAFSCGGLENIYIADLAAWSSINFENAGANPFCYGKNLYIDGELTVELSRIPDGVLNIGSYAFANMNILVNIMIPDSVTNIGEGAFYSCSSLESMDIPDEVTTIGDDAFRYCRSLTSVSLQNGVKEIGGCAFSGCSALKNVFIPGSVTTIGGGAFSECSGLTAIEVSEKNDAYCSENGVLFNNLKTLLIQYPAGKPELSYEIPAGVTTVAGSAFVDCSNLASLTIPGSLTNVNGVAFFGCNSLKDVYISDLAAWCGITFGDTRYDGYMYSSPLSYADNLYINGELATDIFIPDGVTTIGALAFWNYSNLKSVYIPNSVTTIGEEAFYCCSGLTSVTIPASVTTIEPLAFYSCSSLEHVHFLGDVPVLKKSSSKSILPFQWCDEDLTLCYIEGTQGWDEDSYVTYHYNCVPWNYSTESSCVGSTYTCNDCGEVYSVADSSAALGHEWNEGVVTTAPTTTAQGIITYTCIRCGEVKTEVLPSLNPFGDIHTTDYFYDPVLWAVHNGITNGTSATRFSPESPCTRGQIVTFLWRACGSPEPKEVKNPFDDVEENAYYYKAVLWAVEQGITTGVSATKFAPDKTCTRGQVATFLWRSQGKPAPVNSTNPFSDIEDNQYYYNAILWAVENQVTQGTGRGKFSPDSDCTRGQIVTFLYRALEE